MRYARDGTLEGREVAEVKGVAASDWRASNACSILSLGLELCKKRAKISEIRQ